MAELKFNEPIMLLGGGDVDAAAFALASAEVAAVVAADGAADIYQRCAGGVPNAPPLRAVIGDMDSIANFEQWRDHPEIRLLELPEQDSTDLEKCLYSARAPLYLGVGFLGRRFDHTLAACHALLRYADRRLVLFGETDLVLLCPRRWRIRLGAGERFSLYPLAPCAGVRSSGLRWPIDGLAFAAGESIGVSNRSVAEAVEIEIDRRGLAAVLDRRALPAVLASFEEAEW